MNFIKVCYCKDEKCLTTNKCDKEYPLLDLGKNNLFSFNISSYNELFKVDNSYIGWKVYYIPIDYMKVYEDSNERLIGTYYDLFLIPTNSKDNEYLIDRNKRYYKQNRYEILYTNNNKNWVNNDGTLTCDIDSCGKYSIKFIAKKGDIISFDMKTSASNFDILLNDDSINEKIKLNNDIINNEILVKYNTKLYEINENGEYTLTFKDNRLIDDNSNYYVNYHKYTYIKNIKILSPVLDDREGETFIVKNDYEYIVGDYDVNE